jgi:hypothetical protein
MEMVRSALTSSSGLLVRAVLAFIGALFLSLSALSDPFTVRNIPVDATAGDATQARVQAMANGQMTGAQRLLERLTAESMRDLLPELTPEIVRRLVGGIEVDEEFVAGSRYFGSVSVSFRAQQVRGFLAQAGIPYLDSTARPMVLVPIWEGRTLFSDNPLLEGFRISNAPHALAPVLIPRADDGDIAALSLSEASSGDLEALQDFAQRYNASRVMIVRGSGSGESFRASARVIDLLDAERSQDLTPVGGRSIASLANQLAGEMEREWKVQTLVSATGEATVRIGIVYSSLAEWLKVQQGIGKASLVKNARLDALSADGALMTVTYRGTFDQLARELTERGVSLQRGEDGQAIAFRLGTRPKFVGAQ